MSNTLSKILSIVMVVLLVISVGLAMWFFGGVSGLPEDADHSTQIEVLAQPLGALYNWTLALILVAGGAAILFSVANMVLNFKNSIRGLITAVVLGTILLVTYSMSDGAVFSPDQLPGYTGPDNTIGRIKMADMMLNSMYVLFVLGVLAIVFAEVSKIFK